MDLESLESACEVFVAKQTAADPAHDLQHIKRVVNNVRYLTDIEQADSLITIPAAWLHDCVQVPKDSPDRAIASRRAAEEACKFLSELAYPQARLPEVFHAVEAHSFSANIPIRSVEAGVVQDGDRMDALGAVGIARCLLTGGAMGSGLYHPDDPFCTDRTTDDRNWAVDHFYAKLFKLPSTMQTDAGRAEAERRVAFMQRYLAELGHEVGITPPPSGD